MSKRYLDAAQQGKNTWWRYLLSLLLISFFWLILGSIPLFVWLASSWADPETIVDTGDDQLLKYVLFSLSFCFLLVGTYLAVSLIHQRRFRSLIRPDGGISGGRIARGAALWLLLLAVPYGVEAALYPAHFQITFKPELWLVFLPLVLVFTPIQTTAEELFFRGYVLQGLGAFSRDRWFLIVISSLLFGSLHLGNPEMSITRDAIWLGLTYCAFGAFLALITLQDDSLELAIACHAMNNLFLAILIRDQVAALDTPALITRIETPNAQVEFFVLLIQAGLFYYAFFRRRRKPTLPIEVEENLTSED